MKEVNKGLIFYLMIFLMGCFGALGWFVHLFFIINASLNNGIVIIDYNSSGEMVFQILLFSFLFLFSLCTTGFLLFKKGEHKKGDPKNE